MEILSSYSIAREHLKGHEQKLTQIRTVVWNELITFSKVKVTETSAGGGIQIHGSPSKTILLTYISV